MVVHSHHVPFFTGLPPLCKASHAQIHLSVYFQQFPTSASIGDFAYIGLAVAHATPLELQRCLLEKAIANGDKDQLTDPSLDCFLAFVRSDVRFWYFNRAGLNAFHAK